MEIEKTENGFAARKDGSTLGMITFAQNGENELIISHTEVDLAAEGQGVGKQLVEKVVEYARQEKKTIDPQCPFAAKVIERHSDMQDVLSS